MTYADIEMRDNKKSWSDEEWRAPTLLGGDVELYSEPGRIAFDVDFRSYWFKVVKAEYGGYFLLVKHGGGEERYRLNYGNQNFEKTLEPLPSDARFLTLFTYMDVIRTAKSHARYGAIEEYRKAFVEGRLKKRKQPGRNSYKVWIENC
jgi:hypothetical protein